MKRLISAVLALSLMGTAAASAQPFRGGYGGYGGYDRSYHDNYRSYDRDYGRGYQRDRRENWHGSRYNDGGAMIGLGLGMMALAAIASSHNHDRDYQGDYRYGR